MNTLHLSLLGDFKLEHNGELITTVNSTRLQSVLAYLVLHSYAPQPRRHAAFQLWHDSSERQAHNNLRKALHQLRRALAQVKQGDNHVAERWLHVDAQRVHWQPDLPYTLDVTEFETKLRQAHDLAADDPAALQRVLAEAVALYGGDLLPSCYDEWIRPLRERLRQAFLETLERLLWLAEDQRDYATAIHHAQQLLQHDPLHEATYHRLMRLYMLAGNRASALRTYHTCATLLQRELGVDPNPQTQAAYQHLLAAQTPPLLHGHSGRQPDGVPGQRAALVGRQVAWRQLLASWQSAARGKARLVVISGEAGIGKSRLAEELRHWVSQQGLTAVYTRAYAAEGALAYAPVTEWLRTAPLRKQWQQLAPVWLTELARLLPELLVEQPHLPRPEPLTESWQRQRLFETLSRALLAAPQPLLLLLDDLQWCDGETLAWLHHLLRYAPHARLLVVGAMRPEEVDDHHPVRTLLLDLEATEQVTTIELAPLTPKETEALAIQVAGRALSSATLHEIYQASEGNPLFVVEMIHAHPGLASGAFAAPSAASLPRHHPSLPPKVQAVIHHRLQQLSAMAREVAALAAVIGRSFTFPLLTQASELSENALVGALDELWRRRIVREQGAEAYDFSHDRIREVAYAELSAVHRRLLHRRVAQALETVHAAALDTVCSQIATHYDQAGTAASAIIYYQRAATVAERFFAYPDVERYLDRTLALLAGLPETPETREQRIDALLLKGQILLMLKGLTAPAVEAIYGEANALCHSSTQNPKRYAALRGLWLYWSQRSEWQKAATFEAELLQLAQQLADPSYLHRTAWVMGVSLFHQGQLLAARDYLQQAAFPNARPALFDNSFQVTADPGIIELQRLSYVLWLLGYPEQAQSYMNQMLLRTRQLGHPHRSLMKLGWAFFLAHDLRQTEVMQTLFSEYSALLDKYPFPELVAEAKIFQGWLSAQRGDHAAGAELLQQGMMAWSQMGIFQFSTYLHAWVVEVYQQAQQFEQGLALLTTIFTRVEETGERFWCAELYRLRGELLLAQGGASVAAESSLQQAIDLARQQSAKALELRATVSLARWWQSQGRRTEAYALLAPIYNWFTEGFATADLQAARALLTELSSTHS